MKVGLFWISLLIGAVLVCSAAAQSKVPQAERPTLEAALAIEDPEARAAALQQILKARPAIEQADAAREALVGSWAQLGETQLGENNIEKAMANFRQALSALPEKVSDRFFEETVVRIPLAVSVRGYRNEAIDLARQLEKRFAKEFLRLARLGEFFMTIEAPADAIRTLETAAKLSEEDARLHRALGMAYRMGLRLDDAIAEYQQAIGADPQDKRAYYELANLYRAHGAYTDAAKLYQKQLEVEPRHTGSLKGLALCALAQGREEQMNAALNQARDLRGSAEEVTYDIYLQTQMSFYYLKQNRLKQARAAAEAALLVEPRYAWARIAAAEVDLAEGKIFEAERNLLAARQYAGFPSLFFTFGKLYLSVEDFDGALEQFARAFSYSTRLSPKEQFATRLGGTLDVKAEGVKELLSREHQASLFVVESPTSSEQFKQAESLVRFHAWLTEIRAMTTSGKGTVTRKQMEELDRAALDFVETESTRRSFRSLYIAQKLSQAGVSTGLAVELAEQALGLAEVATELDGSLRDYPNYDRNGRLQIFRGRALDTKGWSLYKAGRNEEAIAALDEAVKAYGSLPEGKRALWHLASVKETAGDLNSALEYYIAGYEPPEASGADMKGAVIEVLYHKANGSGEGLEARLSRAAEVTNPDIKVMLNALAQRQTQTSASKTPVTSGRRLPNRKPVESRDAARKDSLAFGNESKPPKPAEISPSKSEQPLEAPPAGTTPVETSKEIAKEEEKASTVTGTILPAGVELVKFPEIAIPDQPIRLAPLLDPQLILSDGDVLKPRLSLVAEEDIPPSPPAARNARPRRVLNPKSQNPDNDSTPQTEPTRLSRPPASTEPTRLRRPPAQNRPPSNQQ
ncbi:MAG TPA: tetratricopeptide repeat protein [Blastocatellia bacterium]|jgi:tetratricopeptide (TPR) repeat protein